MVESSGSNRHKIGDLQVLRGFAILLVLIEHAPLSRALLGAFPHPVTVPGWLGVDLFFIISGYVIVQALARDRFEPLSFFIRRVYRLMPALLVLLGLTGLAVWSVGRVDGSQYWEASVPDANRWWGLAASLVGGYYSLGPLDAGPILGVAWSLSVEDLFYGALTAVCLAAALALRRDAVNYLPAILAGLAASTYLFVLWMRMEHLLLGQIRITSWKPFLFLFFLRFDFLALGVLLGVVDRAFPDRIGRFVELRGPFWTPILLGLPLGLAAVSAHAIELTRLTQGLVLAVAGWCFGLLVLSAAHGRALPPVRNRAYRLWTYLGDRSYTIYLFHAPAFLAATVFLATVPNSSNPLIGGLLHALTSLALLLPLVEVIYRGVERPLTEVGRRLAKKLRLNSVPSAPESTSPIGLLKPKAAA